MSNSRYAEAKDFLITSLRLNASASTSLLGNLTSTEFNQIPSEELWRKLKNFLWEISLRFGLPVKKHENVIINTLTQEDEDNYELKTWHVKKLYPLTSASDEIEYTVRDSIYRDSDTSGVRQCAEAHNTEQLRRMAILRNVFNLSTSSELELSELETSISRLQKLINLMNRILSQSDLKVAELFKVIISITTNPAINAEASDAIANLALTPETLSLLQSVIHQSAQANKIDYDINEKYSYFVKMNLARDKECTRSYRCDFQIEKYMTQLHFHSYFHKDPRVVESADRLDSYLKRTQEHRDTYCSLSSNNFPHYANRSTLGLFKPANIIQDIYTNASSLVEECDFKDLAPFLYFFDETLKLPPVIFDHPLLSNNSVMVPMPDPTIAKNEKDLTILIPMLILLLLLLRTFRFRPAAFIEVAKYSDVEEGKSLLTSPRP